MCPPERYRARRQCRMAAVHAAGGFGPWTGAAVAREHSHHEATIGRLRRGRWSAHLRADERSRHLSRTPRSRRGSRVARAR